MSNNTEPTLSVQIKGKCKKAQAKTIYFPIVLQYYDDTTKCLPFTNLSTNENIALLCTLFDWSKISRWSKFRRTIVRWCDGRKLDGLSFSVLARPVIKLK